MPRKYKKKKTNIVQEHHLEYQRKDEVESKQGEVVRLYKGEHWAITQLQRRKRISKGFIRALEYWVEQNKNNSIDV